MQFLAFPKDGVPHCIEKKLRVCYKCKNKAMPGAIADESECEKRLAGLVARLQHTVHRPQAYSVARWELFSEIINVFAKEMDGRRV